MLFNTTQPKKLARAAHGSKDDARRKKLAAKTNPSQSPKTKMSLRL
jgi:hypothetical protein